MTNNDDRSIVNGTVIFTSKKHNALLRLLSVADPRFFATEKGANLWGGAKPLNGKIVAENYMKMREIGLRWRILGPTLDPPMIISLYTCVSF